MDLAALERAVRERLALDRIAQTHLHYVRQEDDLGFGVGIDHCRRLALSDAAAEPDSMIAVIHDLGDMIAFETASGKRAHHWVWMEKDLIARRVTILDGASSAHGQIVSVGEDGLTLDRLVHAPLGELRSGAEQTLLPAAASVPRDFPSFAHPLADRVHRIWNMRDLAIDDRFRWTGPDGRSGSGLDMKQYVLGFLHDFPDAVALVERAIVQDDKVGLLWRLHAHHQGVGATMAPTGHRVRLQASTIFTLAGNRVLGEDTLFDEVSLKTQLSVERFRLR